MSEAAAENQNKKPKVDLDQFIGPKIVGSNGHFLRVIDDLHDERWFYEVMRDWPVDQEGAFTFQRARKVCAKHYLDSRRFNYPLTEESRYNFTMIYCLEDGERIGYRRTKAIGTTHHIAQQAIHPQHRGQGYSRAMMAPWMVLAREIQQAAVTSLEILEGSGAGLLHMSEGYETEKKGQRVGVTGQNVHKIEVTMGQYRKYMDTPEKSNKDKSVQWTFVDV